MGTVKMVRRLKQMMVNNGDLSEAQIIEVWFLAARALAFLTLLLLAVMPFTEHFWNFDNFCRGGQDFEFSLLAIAMALGLVLLLSLHRKRRLMLVFFIQQWLSLLLRAPDASAKAARQLLDFSAAVAHLLSPGGSNTPLLI